MHLAWALPMLLPSALALRPFSNVGQHLRSGLKHGSGRSCRRRCTTMSSDDTFPFRPTLLANRRAVVTGGNDGIGVAITCALVKAGASCAVVARSKAKFDAMLDTHEFLQGSADFIQADLESADATISAGKAAVAWADGHVDILVNNAGVALLGPLTEYGVEAWDKVMAVNARAPFLMAQACAPGMIERRAGKIINISSQAGTIGIADHAAYCASKAAIDALTRVMTVEWAKHNIQANSIGPTVVMTEMGKRVWGGAAGEPMRQRTPIGRFAEPDEVTQNAPRASLSMTLHNLVRSGSPDDVSHLKYSNCDFASSTKYSSSSSR